MKVSIPHVKCHLQNCYLTFHVRNLSLYLHVLRSSFFLFSVALFGLHRMKKFSVRHSQPFFVVFEWGAALLSIVHLSGRNDPCWTISAIVSYVHLKIFRYLSGDLNP